MLKTLDVVSDTPCPSHFADLTESPLKNIKVCQFSDLHAFKINWSIVSTIDITHWINEEDLWTIFSTCTTLETLSLNARDEPELSETPLPPLTHPTLRFLKIWWVHDLCMSWLSLPNLQELILWWFQGETFTIALASPLLETLSITPGKQFPDWRDPERQPERLQSDLSFLNSMPNLTRLFMELDRVPQQDLSTVHDALCAAHLPLLRDLELSGRAWLLEHFSGWDFGLPSLETMKVTLDYGENLEESESDSDEEEVEKEYAEYAEYKYRLETRPAHVEFELEETETRYC